MRLLVFTMFALSIVCLSCGGESLPTENNEDVLTSVEAGENIDRVLPLNSKASENEIRSAKERPIKAVVDSGFLMVLGGNGLLLKADLEEKKVIPFPFTRYVADFYVDNMKSIYILTSEQEASEDWKILRGNGEVWTEVANLKTGWGLQSKDKKDRQMMIGLAVYKEQIIVLSTHTVFIQHDKARWRSLRLTVTLQLGLQTPFAVTDDGSLYYGLNHGEWGGGLRRIDLSNGKSILIEKKSRGDICSSPLDSQCDPVTSVLKDPADPNAILAGVGLRHMSQHGSVLRVKKDDVNVIFKKKYGYDEVASQKVPAAPCEGINESDDLDSYESEAVFGMQADGDKVWVVTGRAVYSLFGGEIESCSPLPDKFENIDGMGISAAVPGVILLGTDINWAKSLSGRTPLLAIR